jgi:hypothetical protein
LSSKYILEDRISGRQHDIERGQWIWGISLMLVGFGFLFLPYVGLLSVPVFIAAILGFIRYSSGPGYVILFKYRRTLKMRSRRKHPHRRRKVMTKEPIDVALYGFPLGLTPEQEELALDLGIPENLGVSYFPPRDSDVSTIVAQGWDAANMDPDDLFQEEHFLAHGMMETARRSYPSITLTIGLRSRPLNTQLTKMQYAANAHLRVQAVAAGQTLADFINDQPDADQLMQSITPEMLAEAPSVADKSFAKDWQELQGLLKTEYREPTAFFCLNVPRPRYWPSAPRGDIDEIVSPWEMSHSPIVKLTNILEQSLISNGVKNVRALSLDDTKTFVRTAWDLSTVERWHTGATTAPDGTPINPDWPWPATEPLTGVDEDGLEYLDYDGTYSRVYRVYRLNHRRVSPGEFRELFSPNGIGPAGQTGLTVAWSGDTILSARESKITTTTIRFRKAFFLLKDRGKLLDTSALEVEENALLEDRRDALDYGGSHAFSYNTLATTSATSLKLLKGVDEALQRKANELNIVCRLIPWESDLDNGFWTCNIGAGMM